MNSYLTYQHDHDLVHHTNKLNSVKGAWVSDFRYQRFDFRYRRMMLDLLHRHFVVALDDDDDEDDYDDDDARLMILHHYCLVVLHHYCLQVLRHHYCDVVVSWEEEEEGYVKSSSLRCELHEVLHHNEERYNESAM